MPPKKRPYVRKTKGCYPCARRRIHCDRTEPCCQKCAGRGLECTGLGLRVRFPYGAPQHPQPATDSDTSTQTNLDKDVEQSSSQTIDFTAPDTIDPSILDIPWESLLEDLDSLPTHGLDGGSDSTGLLEWGPIEELPDTVETGFDDIVANDGQIVGLGDVGTLTAMTTVPPLTLSFPMPETIPRWKRNMCLHFSRHIATEMTAIDGMHNGWRYLVLPIAHNDQLILDAVVTVSLYHIVFNRFRPHNAAAAASNNEVITTGTSFRDPNEMYNRVIYGLQHQPNLNNCDEDTKTSILVTILVLFVGAMVTGRTDFPLLARMLESAVEALGGENNLPEGAVTTFIKQQMHKIRLYAAPLLDEQKGMEVISSHFYTEQLFSSLTDQLTMFPQYGPTTLFVRDIIQQAIDLYLEQVRLDSVDRSMVSNMDMVSSVVRVQHFKETLEAFPVDVPGQAVLVWATFVAASGSVLDEHRRFFEQVFLKHHERSGFINLLEGLEYLKRIWERSPNERWTRLLAQAHILVM